MSKRQELVCRAQRGESNMKPCDCKDQDTVDTELNEQGISFNNESIEVRPLSVILRAGACTMKISQVRFKTFAEWYLADQVPTE